MADNKLATLAPEMNALDFRQQRNKIIEFVSSAMNEGVDYGIIPGTQKESLWKAGAEKLLRLFGLVPSFELVKEVEDFEKGFFYYKYRCTLTHGKSGVVVGNAERSCNSMEKKYAFVTKPEQWATDAEKARAVEKKKNKKYNSWDLVLKKTPEEAADLVNTIQAMAQKRALVGVTQTALSATEIFGEETADIEGQLEQAKLMRKLHVVAAERGFDHDTISSSAKKKYKVKSTSELNEKQLQEMIDNLEAKWQSVGKGNKPVRTTDKQVETAEEGEVVEDREEEIAEALNVSMPKKVPEYVKNASVSGPWEEWKSK